MIRSGLRLRWFLTGDEDYQLQDLVAFIDTSPMGSALTRQALGEDAAWGVQEDLSAIIADRLGWIHFALVGQKGDEPPAPLYRHARDSVGGGDSAMPEFEAEEVDLNGECLMVCVWESIPHKEISQNDYCGTTRPG